MQVQVCVCVCVFKYRIFLAAAWRSSFVWVGGMNFLAHSFTALACVHSYINILAYMIVCERESFHAKWEREASPV